MNARNRSLSSPTVFGTIASVKRCHAASVPSPASVMVPASNPSIVAAVAVDPSGDWRTPVGDERAHAGGKIAERRVRSVDHLMITPA